MLRIAILLFLLFSLTASGQQVYVSPLQGEQLTFSTVGGTGAPAWSASEGAITQSGVFVAPLVQQPTLVIVTATWAPGVTASATVLVRGEPPIPSVPGTIVIDVQSGATLVLSDGSLWTAPDVTSTETVPIANTGLSARVNPINPPPPPPPPPPVVDFDCATLDLNNAVVVAPFSRVATAAQIQLANGTCQFPYRMEHLYGRVAPSFGHLKPGMTVWFLPGDYNFDGQHIDWHSTDFGDPNVAPVFGGIFWVRNGGTAAAPVWNRCAVPMADQIGACRMQWILAMHNEQKGAYLRWVDFEFTHPSQGRASAEIGSFPLDVNHRAGWENSAAEDTWLINSIIRDTATGMTSFSDAGGGRFYGNFIYNNGWVGPDREHGPAIYTQNNCAEGEKLFDWNYVFRNARHGIQAFGSGVANVACMKFRHMVVLGNDGGRQIIIPGAATASDLEISDSWIVGADVSEVGDHDLVKTTPRFDVLRNTWINTNLLYPQAGPQNFTVVRFNGLGGQVAGNTIVGQVDWRNMASQVAQNTVATKPPDNVTVADNEFDPRRIEVVVVNGSKLNEVPVTLTIRAEGRPWRAFDVECLRCGPVLTGSGRNLVLPVNQTAIEAWGGSSQPNFALHPGLDFKHSPVEFGAYVVFLDK